MSFEFNPMSDDELNAVDLVPDGVYSFEIISSSRKPSKAGNPMAVLHIRFWDKDGKAKTLFDYLVFSQVKMNLRKIKNFCDTTGLHEDYKKGSIPEDLGGYCGEFELRTEPEQPKPNGGWYAPKNVVAGYVSGLSGEQELAKPPTYKSAAPAKDFDDDIPF